MMLVLGCGLAPPSREITSKSVKAEPVVETPEEPVEEYTPVETPAPAVKEIKETSYDDEQAKAHEAAMAFVKTLDGYKNQMGRGLEVISSVKTSCEGCWIVEMRFERDLLYYPDKTEFIKVNVHLKNWKMDTYEFG
jgi:hypothetical protein